MPESTVFSLATVTRRWSCKVGHSAWPEQIGDIIVQGHADVRHTSISYFIPRLS